MKGGSKIPIKQKEEAESFSPVKQLFVTLQNNLSDNVCCIVTALLALALTMLIFVKFKKKAVQIEEKVADLDKLKKEERALRNKASVSDDEKNDSSEGQEASEEDLPWLLQNAPSEISLSDEKKRWADEKHSECSVSDKSQESVRMIPTGTGCGDSHLSKSIKVLTADPDYVFTEE